MRVGHVFLRPSEGCDQQSRVLRFPPGRAVECELGEEPLEHFTTTKVEFCRLLAPGDIPPVRDRAGFDFLGRVHLLELRSKPAAHAVAVEERQQFLSVLRAEAGRYPAPVLGMHNGGHVGNRLGGVPARLPEERCRARITQLIKSSSVQVETAWCTAHDRCWPRPVD